VTGGAARVARPAVLRRLPLDRHAIIEASAGTGKTFTLENIVVEVLLGTDVPLDRLLVVTFTEKATHEIRTRVRARLEELRTGKGTPPTDEEARAGDYWTIDGRAREKLEHALRAFDGATIATIHAFCFSVLRENAFASGRLFQERQVDGRESFGRAFRDALRRDVARDPARAPWLEAALRAGTSIEGVEELLWRCMEARGEPRPRFDVAELAAAVEAFPVDDARDTRVEAELSAQHVNPARGKTIVRDVRALAALVGRMRGTSDWPSFIEQASGIPLGELVERLGHVDVQRPSRAQPVLAAALALARSTPSFQAALVQATFGPVRDEFMRAKRVAGQYDFDDMLALVDDALRGPRGAAIAEAMRRRWRYALIDEFQDTDETQWSIFRRAFFEAGPGPASVAVFVGDPKQSIYRFRGADVQTYLGARDAVAAAGGTRLSLDRNFRATPGLVDAMNHLFEETTNGGALLTGANEYQPVQCGRPGRALVDGDGRVVAPVGVLRFQDEAAAPELGRRIAAEIARMTDPARPWRLDGRALEPSDVFVLTRTDREGRALGDCFRAAGVPHAFYRQEGLFQCVEAEDVRALLAAIADPHDRANRLRAWLTPFFGLPLASIEGARDLPAAHPLVARLHEWKAIADARRFDRLFESILRETGVIRREIFFADGERSLTNTLHLLEVLLEQSRDGHPTLLDLVNGLSRLIDKTRSPLDVYEGNVQRIESERRAVQIMTMHKAKGLEAAVVFVAGGLWKGRGENNVRVYHDGGHRLAWVGPVPKEMSERIKDEEREEYERLMYVALTRAIGRLVVPCVVDSRGDTKGKRRAGQATGLQGPFDAVNRKLAQLLDTGDPLFEVEEVTASPGRAASEPTPLAWQPPAELLRDDDAGARHGRLRERAAGAIVTSYTRLRGERAAPRAVRERMEDQRSDKGTQAIDDGFVPLRGARGSGVFLHEVLERVPTTTFAAADLDTWRRTREVAALFDEAATVHRIEPSQRPHAEEMVWRAFTSPVALPGDGGRLDGLWRARRVVREMDFVFPIPGREEVGYVRGSLDLAFEHEGLTYFVDWKSDSLASYAPGVLERHVAAHYGDQVALYTLAIGKLLGIRSAQEHAQRFGGIVYCFLRGVDGSGGGHWASRPTWDDVAASEAALRKRDWTSPRRSA
jgi:exodeoxyribonuclease V beta subunit